MCSLAVLPAMRARRNGTLAQITEPLINDFAVVFSLSPRQLMRLKDILLQQPEDLP